MSARNLLLAGLLAGCLCLAQQAAVAGEDELKTITYPVADLVIPIMNAGEGLVRLKGTNPPTVEASLVDAIERSIAPKSWENVGGRGTIQYQPGGMALVIKQNQENHEHISDLLAVLRRLHSLQVALEVRMLTVPETFVGQLEREFGADFISLPRTGGPVDAQENPQEAAANQARHGGTPGVAFMSHDQVLKLSRIVERDRRLSLMAMPKMTVFNGQAGTLTIQDTKSFILRVKEEIGADGRVCRVPVEEAIHVGIQMKALPTVSADRRYVQVALEFSDTKLAHELPSIPVQVQAPSTGTIGRQLTMQTVFLQRPILNCQTIATTVAIPDGNTAILCGPKYSKKDTMPVVGSIPFLKSCFESEPTTMLIMVTPRVILCEDEPPPAPVVLKKVLQPVCIPVPVAYVPPSPASGLVQAGCTMPVPAALPQRMPTGPSRTTNLLSDLLKAYDEACAAGQADEAERLARAALTIDVTCFQRRR
jgi:Bacterial type II and III secretion system protein